MPKVVGPPESVAAVGQIACRIRRFAEAIQQAHHFGIGPGEEQEPWTVEFQRQAVPVYAKALPWDYLLGLASGFTDGADLMVELSGPRTAATEWVRMQAYLRAAAKAIRDDAPPLVDAAPRSADEIEATTPPVMPFDHLARMIHPDGAASLRQIGAAIERCCDGVDDCPLTDQELEWMRQLVDGARSIDVATASGYSERSFYRALSDLWERLGVDSRQEGLVLVAASGWISA